MPTPEENQVLALLAMEWDRKGPPGIMDTSDIVAALSLAPSDTLAALNGLFKDGLIDMNRFKSGACLTPEGYDLIEQIRKQEK